MSMADHSSATPSFRCAVITVSNTHTEETDRPGSYLRSRLEKAGHRVVLYRILPREVGTVRESIEKLAGQVDLAFYNGATPAAPYNSEAVITDAQLDQPIPAFSQVYQTLAYEKFGPTSILTQATAGIHKQTLYFSLPGTLNGVKLGMEKLILPELREVAKQLLPSMPVV